MRAFNYFLVGLLLGGACAAALVAQAVQISVPSASSAGYYLVATTTGNYVATTTDPAHFGSLFATSSTATSIFKGALTVSGNTSLQAGTSTNFAVTSQGAGCAQFNSIGSLVTTGSVCSTLTLSSFSASAPLSYNNGSGAFTFNTFPASTLAAFNTSGVLIATTTAGIASFNASSTSATSTVSWGLDVGAAGGCIAFNGTCLQTYIQNAAAYKSAANYATAAVLPGTPTYSNGASGVGATLTEVGFGALVVDGQTVTLGQRILVKNEADQTTNGVYVVSTVGSVIANYVLTRSTDYNTSNDVYAGTTIPVLAGGTANGDTQWTESNTGTIVIGTSNITFIETSYGTNGTVTSVAASVPSVLSISGSPITGAGTLAIGYSGTALPVANGGTNATSLSSHSILTFNGTSVIGSSTPAAANFIATSSANSVFPNFTSSFSTTTNATTTNLFSGTASSTNLFSSLSTIGTLTLGNALTVANGGTGAKTLTGCLTGNGTGAITGSGTCNTSSASVTSVDMSVPAFLSIANNPITTSGTLALTLSGTALPFANGGTGRTSGVGGDTFFYSASTTALQRVASSTGGTIYQTSFTTGAPTWVATSTLKILFSDLAGTLALTQMAAQNAGTVVANGTGSSAAPTAISTSTLYGTCTGGQVIGWSNIANGLACVATSTGSGSGTVNSGTTNNLAYYTGATAVSSSGFITETDTANYLGIGTTTPRWLLNLASSTAPQLTLSSASLTDNPWSFRVAPGGTLYISTSSPASPFATSTVEALSINSNTGSTTIKSLVVTGATKLAAGLTGAVVATAGDITAGTLSVANGGTGAVTITGLVLGNGSSAMSAYAGSNPCSNQVALSLSASGVITCTSITDAMFSGALAVAHGGTNATSLSGSALLAGDATGANVISTSTIGFVRFFATSTTAAASSQVAGFMGFGTTTPFANLSLNAPSGTTPFFDVGSSTQRIFSIVPGGNSVNFYANVATPVASSSSQAATYTVNWATGSEQRFILNQATSIVINSTSSNPVDGGWYKLKVCQDPAGSRTLTFITPGQLRWGTLGTTTISSTANTCTFILFNYDATYSVYTGLASTTGVRIN